MHQHKQNHEDLQSLVDQTAVAGFQYVFIQFSCCTVTSLSRLPVFKKQQSCLSINSTASIAVSSKRTERRMELLSRRPLFLYFQNFTWSSFPNWVSEQMSAVCQRLAKRLFSRPIKRVDGETVGGDWTREYSVKLSKVLDENDKVP